MADIYQGWLQKMKNFKASIDKELAEMRRCKSEMQQLKKDLANQYAAGYYKRDDKRIVISAPEIVIGNVLKDGTLIPNESSTVIIRSNNIRQEGVGTAYGSGSITNKATEIKNICVDSGLDGLEAVVKNNSSFTVQAQGITLQSEKANGTFAETPCALKGELSLYADEHIVVSAQAPLSFRKTRITEAITELENDKTQFENLAKSKLVQIENCTKSLNTLHSEVTQLFNSQVNGKKEAFKAAPKVVEIKELQNVIKIKHSLLYQLIKEFQECTSKAAEANRQAKTLKEAKTAIEETEKKIKNHENTHASVDIFAENTNIQSIDAGGDICKSKDAGVSITAKNMAVNALDSSTGLIDDSNFSVNMNHVKLSTANKKPSGEKFELPAEGDVVITSRDIILESVDKEYLANLEAQYAEEGGTPGGDIHKSEIYPEKELTKGGIIKLRAKNVFVRSQAVDGKAEGEFNVNSKIVKMGGYDCDKNSGTISMAEESLFDVKYNASNVYGENWVCINSQKDAVVSALENLELQQSTNNDSLLQLSKGKATLKGNETNIMGTTTMKGETTFKANAQFETASIKELQVSSAIKTPNSQEGSPGKPASAGKEEVELFVKLDELENKIKEITQKAEEVQKQEEEAKNEGSKQA